jgi:hypothetical protein
MRIPVPPGTEDIVKGALEGLLDIGKKAILAGIESATHDLQNTVQKANKRLGEIHGRAAAMKNRKHRG